MRRAASIVAPLGLVFLLLVGWETACRVLAIPLYLLPPPSAVVAALIQNIGPLAISAGRTLTMALEALVVASLFACTLALVTSLSKTLERAIRPLAVSLQVTPVVAIAPLVVIWAGIDHSRRAIVILAAIVAFFPIFSGALRGLGAADPDLALHGLGDAAGDG